MVSTCSELTPKPWTLLKSCHRDGGVHPVLDGAQPSEPQLDPIDVVVVDVVVNRALQGLDALELIDVEQLALQCSKEAFHGCIVETVPLAGHALHEPVFLKTLSKRRHAVLPPLI